MAPTPKRNFKKSTKVIVRRKVAFKRARMGPTRKTIAKIAQQVVSRNAENKTRQFSTTRNMAVYNGNQDNNVFPVSPYASFLEIFQGTGQGDRIGNKIKIKSGSITFSLWPYNYNVATNAIPVPQNILFILFYDRDNDTQVPTPTFNGDFYQDNGSGTGFTGNLTDLTRWINTDRYRVVYKRHFKLGFAQNPASGADPNNAQWSNNDYKLNILNFKVNTTKWLIENVKYDDNTAIPSTRGLYGMFISVPCNGSTWGSTQIPSTFTYQTRVVYEDS